jgi:carbon-monoxide dehydrogenase large subunit
MGEFAFGQGIKRVEDWRLLVGKGRFIDDVDLPRQSHALVLRSPHAHARIRGIDVSAAASLPGVLAVLTGDDLKIDRIRPIRCDYPMPRFPKDGPVPGEVKKPPYPVLAQGLVRFVGDPVAMVVAENLSTARDALEAISVDYDPLPAVTDMSAAIATAAPQVWDEVPGNVAFVWQGGQPNAVAEAFARAAHVTRIDVVNNRVSGAAMEPRGAVAFVDGRSGRAILETSTQMPHGIKKELAQCLGIDASAIRVLVSDVGGSFGLKNALYPEQVLVAWASRRVGRPVKWVADRTETFLADYAARDNLSRVELALDRDGRFLALRVETLANLGAYLSPKGPLSPVNNAPALANVYGTPAIHTTVRGVFTHTVSTDVYRGAGRPEALYLIERVVDAAARELGLEPLELRRRNLIAKNQLPRLTPLGLNYDSGDFEHVLRRGLVLADRAGFARRRQSSAEKGRLRGFGFAHFVERVAGGWTEDATLEIESDGRARVLIGTMSNGQGHATAYAQLVADRLGLGLDEVEVVQGDTDRIADGHGTGGSASLAIGGGALHGALIDVVEQAKAEAAEALEAAAGDIEFADGRYAIAGTDRSVAFRDVVGRLAARRGKETFVLAGKGHFAPTNHTYPNGCHVAEVEIDPDTGRVDLANYVVAHDFGRVLNPLLLQGQIHGGVVQGIGQALWEELRYSPDNGQMQCASLMDYVVPRAADLPSFVFESCETPSPTNPLGVKGCGEAGAAGAPPALVSAVLDALAPYGVRHIDMPLTSERVWRALQRAPAPGNRPPLADN